MITKLSALAGVFFILGLTSVLAQVDVYGSYLEFNGQPINGTPAGQFVQIANNATLNFDETQGFSIQFWINPKNFITSSNAFQGIVTKKTATGIGYGIFWDVTGSGNGRIQLLLKETVASGGSSRSISTPTIADANALGWTHVTAVVERNPAPATDSAYIYFNGELVVRDQISTIGDVTNSQPLQLMNYAGNTTNECSGGSLDEVRIWNTALTVRQIHRFYAEPIARNNTGLLSGKVISTFTGKRSFLLDWSKLAGYWDMEETLPTFTITDKSDNTNDGAFYQATTACAVSGCGPAFRNFGDPSYSPKETFVSIASGDWSDASTWSGGSSSFPDSDRAIVFVKDGYTITIDGTFTTEDLNIEDGSTVTASSLSVLQVVKYMHIDGNLDCKTAGTVLFDEVGSHWIYGEGNADFFNFSLFENSQLTVDTENNTPINIYGVLLIGDGRLRTNDDVILKVNKSNTNRPYGLVSPVGVGTPDVRGTIIMEKQLSANNAGWRQMCMPLKGTLADFTGLPLSDNSSPVNQQNVFFWDNAQNMSIPTNNVGWTSASLTDGQGKSYSIYLDGANYAFDTTLTFEGEYNFGDTTYILTYYNDPGNPLTSGQTGYENGVGWNFIPNRYPSLLDVQQMIIDNPLNYKPIHIWDANTQQYMAFTDNPGDFIVPYNNAGTNIAELAGAAIEPMQGFWVKTDNTENGASFTVQDAWRSTDFALNPHASLKTNSLIQLNVFSAKDSTWDGVGIALNEESSSLFDPKSDVYKFRSNSNVPSLSVEKDARFLQIGHYPTRKNRFMLHFNAQPENKSGLYHLHLERPVENNKSLILEDLVTGKRHNLSKSVYTFWATETQESGRFVIHLLDTKKADALISTGNNLIAYFYQHEIVVESPFIAGPIQLRVYDMAGRIVAQYDGEMNQELRLPAPPVDGVLILEVQHNGGTERIKLTSAN